MISRGLWFGYGVVPGLRRWFAHRRQVECFGLMAGTGRWVVLESSSGTRRTRRVKHWRGMRRTARGIGAWL